PSLYGLASGARRHSARSSARRRTVRSSRIAPPARDHVALAAATVRARPTSAAPARAIPSGNDPCRLAHATMATGSATSVQGRQAGAGGEGPGGSAEEERQEQRDRE